ncbi:MAG: right-handed parallel beta-helix repeat-containing protein [Planctomycetota bacterium]
MKLFLHTALIAASFVPALRGQLAGTFFINPDLPLTAVTFPSFADATAALAAQGVSGPCEFLVYDDAGPYNESNAFTTNNGQFGTSDAVLTMTSWTGASSTNRITFRAADGERPVLDATGRAMGVFWGGADFVTLQGLEIRGAGSDGISLYAESQHGIANDPIIDSCRIHDCDGTAVCIYGNSSQPANTIVSNCTMWRCQLTGQGIFVGTGRFGYICSRRSNGTRILHNTFVVDTLSDSSTYCAIGARCSSVTELPFDEISNNIFVKSTASTAPLFRFDTPANSNFVLPGISDANCFFDTSGGPFAFFGAGAGTTAATLADWQLQGRDGASVDGDPQFRNAGNDDFHLTASSPCRDASTLMAGVALDAEGQPRSAPEDIGSDEFSAADYTLVGAGCAGSNGLVPNIDLLSWPYLGNPALPIGFANAPANSIVGLFGALGLSPVPLPLGAGCDALLDAASLVALAATTTGSAGSAAVSFPVPSSPTFAGFEIGYQGLVLDQGAALGFSVTNAIDVTFDF